MNDVAELTSLGLTPVTILLSLLVILFWWKEAKRVFKTGPRSAEDWFIAGVVIGFFGSTVDNFYWGIAWVNTFVTNSPENWWFIHGSYCNIFFRQLAGSIAAYCHVRSAIQYNDLLDVHVINKLTIAGLVLGIVGVILLNSTGV